MEQNINEIPKIELEENEIMRMSIIKLDSDDGSHAVCVDFENGKEELVLQALVEVLEKNFNMICLPKDSAIVIGVGLVDDLEEDEDDEGEGDRE